MTRAGTMDWVWSSKRLTAVYSCSSFFVSREKKTFFPAHTQETQWLTFFPLSRSLSSRRLLVRTTHELAPVVFTVHEHDENYK